MRRIPDTDRVKIGLKEAITLLCKTGLTFESELSIEGLLGITLDQNEVFLVNIKEVIKNPMDFHVSSSENTPENQDFLVSTKHFSGSQQSLNCAENEAGDNSESDIDDKSEIQCHLYKNEWKPSDSDADVDDTTELDDVLSNRSTASAAPTAEGNDTLQMKPVMSHTWDDSGSRMTSANDSSLNLTVQQSEETAAPRESHKADPDETLVKPLATQEDGNQSNTWPSTVPYSTSSSSLPTMPMNLTQKHKAPAVAKSASINTNRPIAMSSRVEQPADDCEQTKAKRCRIERVNHNAPPRQERWSPESQMQLENTPQNLVTNEGGPSRVSPWLPSVSISEGSSEVIIVKAEPTNDVTPEAVHESRHSSPSSAAGRDWRGQRTDGIVSSSASILSPYNEPDAHARWLQNIAAHVQGLRAPAYALPCPSMVQAPQPLMGLLSSGKCVSAMREGATFATPTMNKLFPSDALSQHRRHYHKKGGAATSAPTQTSCVNCGTLTTTMWRRDAEGQPVCNACGLYYKLHQVSSPALYHDGLCSQGAPPPPHLLPQRSPRRLDQKCTNCGITATTAWRRNPDGQTVCNACGLYYKLYKVNRPLSMVKGEIHSRRRKPKGVTYSHTDDNIPIPIPEPPTFGSPDT